jgi:hypothetical protein
MRNLKQGNRDGSVGIATGYGLDVEILLLFAVSRPVLGPTQSPIQWIPEAFSQVVKRPRREVDHSPPTSADGRNI